MNSKLETVEELQARRMKLHLGMLKITREGLFLCMQEKLQVLSASAWSVFGLAYVPSCIWAGLCPILTSDVAHLLTVCSPLPLCRVESAQERCVRPAAPVGRLLSCSDRLPRSIQEVQAQLVLCQVCKLLQG